MRFPYKTVLISCCLLLSACASNRPFTSVDQGDWSSAGPDGQPAHRVYIVGETGELDPSSPLVTDLRNKLATESKKSTLVITGSLSEHGMPDSSTVTRESAEARVHGILDLLDKNFEGRIVVVPSDKDWGAGPDGLQRLEEVVEEITDKNSFRPDDGFPGPDVVKLTDGFRLVALDTQWWLARNSRRFGETDEYELQEPADFLNQIEEVIDDHKDETLLFVGHHPLVSNGRRGGHFPLRTHLFPLTEVVPGAYLPLPIVGSLYPLYVRLIGGRQDLMGEDYRVLRKSLMTLLSEHDRVIFAAGHERFTQYGLVETGELNLHHLIAGTVGKPSPAAGSNGASYVGPHGAYSTLSYFEDGTVWLEVFGQNPSGNVDVVFKSKLLDESPPPVVASIPDEDPPNYADSVVVVAANPNYAAGPIKNFFMGAHHRNSWAQPIQVRLFDIGSEFGGLTPIKRGGGQQTVSLRMENDEGMQYVLRSIDKRPENSIPEVFRKTIAREVLRDQTSGQHPYGAFVIPPLADAVGVFHTSPELVYVPDDPRLGQYRSTFADQLMMLEDRPDDDMSAFSNYGFSSNVVSQGKMYESILEDNDNMVDQRAFVRVRLFDMLLSDWDRHRDQWRWAEFETTDGLLYKPIPRDRDWALNKWDGLLPVLASYVDPKFRGFNKSYGDVKGLSSNGYEQDRRFLNTLERTDWIEIADSIRQSLTDDVIEGAIRSLPPESYDISGPYLIDIMKVRRDKLVNQAERYYKLLARVVDVVGSNKHEEFTVERKAGTTTVRGFKIRKTGERRKQVYEREFLNGETDEIRIYGLGGNDRFHITGEARNGVRIVVVGGTGEDEFVDQSYVKGIRKLSRFFDNRVGNSWTTSRETQVYASDDPLVNLYDQRGSYQHNGRLPAFYFGRNRDDGLFLGGGFKSIKHGFRKAPYASSNKLVANFASKTGAYNAVYSGHFVSLLGRSDVSVSAHAFSPTSVRNYYGLGNETENTIEDRSFYQAGIQRYGGSVSLTRYLTSRISISAGPFAELINVDEDPSKFIALPQPGLSPTTFSDQVYTGGIAGVSVSTLDNDVNPLFGVRWNSTATYNVGLTKNTTDYSKLQSDLSLFISPLEAPQVTTAFRIGGRHTIGEFPFFDAATIGSSSNVRGYRNNRFAGRSSAFVNTELRVKLANVSTVLAVGDLGILGFLDSGRVWTDQEESSIWHSGYGGGIWFNYANLFIIQATVAISDEGNNEIIGVGFQF